MPVVPIRMRMIIVLAAVLLAASTFAADRMPTPSTGTGPFLPVDIDQPMDNDLTQAPGRDGTAQGTVLYIDGRVLDRAGKPVDGVEVAIWQVDIGGNYDHPGEARSDIKRPSGGPVDADFQHWGKTTTDGEGRYRFKTIVPAHYDAGGGTRPNHVHYRLRHPGFRTLATEMNFAGDPHLEDDFVTARLSDDQLAALAVEPRAATTDDCWQACERGAKAATFDVVLVAR